MEATSASTIALELALAVLNEPHQRLPYARQLLPVSPTEDDGSSFGFCGSIPSTSTALPDLEKANPLLWPSWMTPTKDNDNCCSLLDNIWTCPSPATEKNTNLNEKVNHPLTNVNSSLDRISENLTTPTPRTIVKVDVEFIGTNDEPHHPLDQEATSHPCAPRRIRKLDGIAVNHKTGQIYVPDRQNNVVLILGPDGSFQSQLGGPGCRAAQFWRPTAVAFDSEGGQLYITDKDNHRVQVFNAISGHFLFTFGSEGKYPGQLHYPWGIAILNKEGCSLVAVADSRNARVQFFTKDGLYLDYFDAFSTPEERRRPSWTINRRKTPLRNQPRGLAFDPKGEILYITDFNHNCIFRLDLVRRTLNQLITGLAATTTAASTSSTRIFNRPCGIDVDSDGNLIVCDQRHNSLRMFRKDGTEVEGFLKVISFEMPTDVSLYPGLPGYLAVIDLNGRVRVINYSN